ncbi:sugar phosphate isomerase/epimerase [Candidatus Pacearchaeota archaeon]|nr:sugar phosphate isomerase/epimerase [Candidatus Pacearchaeota archaeon]
MPKSNYKIGDYKISDIYSGGYSSLAPSQNIYSTSGNLGMTTDPRTANILQDVSAKLSTGARHIEVEGVSPEIFDSIPRQQLKEVHRLSKLTGVDISMHAPIVEPSGITQQGYSESEREAAERRIVDSLLRAKELNPDGNIPVNFHSAAGIPSSQFLPYSKRKKDEEYQKLIIVNRETGRLAPIEPKIQYSLAKGNLQPEKITPEQELEMINHSEWQNSVSQLLFQKERADEILERHRPHIEHLIEDINAGKFKEGAIPTPEQQAAWRHFKNAEAYLQDLHKQANTLFSKATEFANEHQKMELRRISENFKEKIEKSKDPFTHSQAMNEVIHELKDKITPEMYVPIEKFAVEKASQTFGNAAYKTYKEFKGKNVPLLIIENPPAEVALSTGEGIRDVVKKSREIFIENAKKEGMSESQARHEAEKLIGATWDVGHINMLRKFGYSEEDIVKETEKIAPYLKEIHLSDNFGFEHTELPMGMGNVPLQKMMEKLGEKGFEAKKIIEASAWWQHFKSPPFQESLEALGSPVYGLKMAPYWSQSAGLYQGYFSGMEGPWLPQINYETVGAGFARLPVELGGSSPGGQGGRMSGRAMD